MRINMGKHVTWLMRRNVWLMQLYMSPWHKRIPYLCIYNYNLKIFWFFNHLFFQMNYRNEIFSFLLWNFQVHKVMKMYNENKIFVTYLSNQSMVSLILCLVPLVPSLVYLKKSQLQGIISFLNCIFIHKLCMYFLSHIKFTKFNFLYLLIISQYHFYHLFESASRFHTLYLAD